MSSYNARCVSRTARGTRTRSITISLKEERCRVFPLNQVCSALQSGSLRPQLRGKGQINQSCVPRAQVRRRLSEHWQQTFLVHGALRAAASAACLSGYACCSRTSASQMATASSSARPGTVSLNPVKTPEGAAPNASVTNNLLFV